MMKLATFFLFIGCLQLSARAYSQKDHITLSLRQVSLEEAFSAIHQESGYLFLYNNEKLAEAHTKVSLDLQDASIEQVMSACLKGLPLSYNIIDQTVIITPKKPAAPVPQQAAAPQPVVSGTVTDSTGKGLAGVTVQLKGTGQGTVTDVSGRFSLEAPGDGVLIFSYIGYLSQTVSVSNRQRLSVVLHESGNALSQVVVVGYGTEKKADLTGAIAQIGSRDIASRPVPNITTSLQGLLPGLNIQSNNGDPGANPDINIRGFNSINGGGPLVLVDGIEGDIDRINPADVASVTVLKDAASAAIYGARGAFGVILITTKKGKEGKLSLDYTNNIGWTTPTTRTDFISDPYLYGKTVDAAIFGYNGTSYTGYSGADWDTIKMVAAGKIAPFHRTLANGNNKFFYNTNWYNYLFRKWQPFQNHSISMSGGSKKLQAYVSGRYYKTGSIQNIVDAHLIKYNLKANVNFQATDWLQLSDNVQFSSDDQIEYAGAKNGYGGIWSSTTWYWLFPFMPNKLDGMSYDYQGTGAQAALEDASNWKRTYSEQLINTFSGVLTPFKGMVVNFDYSNTINHIANSTRLNTYQHLTGPKIRLQTDGVNSLTEVRNRNYYKALNIYGTYTRSIAENHHFKLMLGYNQESYDADDITAEQGDLLTPDLANLNLGTNTQLADGSASVWAVKGDFGRFNYDYKNKYLLEVNGRYDGSSRFPSVSRWGFFPSVSAGWFISHENFWRPLQRAVSSLKLRASYGKLGNQNIGLYTFSEILSLGQTSWLVDGNKLNYAGAPAPLPGVVSWESTRTIDVGADLGFLDNRLTASFDWYQKNTSGMYVPGSPLPGVFGAAEPRENIAGLRDIGFEATVGYNGQFTVKGAPLHVRATLSVYNFNGVITKYPNPNGLMSTYWKGQKLGQIWGYHIAGQFKSDEEAAAYQSKFANPSKDLNKVYNYILNVVTNSDWKKLRAGDIEYVDLNGDGQINNGSYTLADHGDIRPIGNAMPQFPFGFTLAGDWKNFDVMIAGAGVGHQDWYPTGYVYWGSYARPYASFIRKDLVADAWSPDNPHGKYPQIYRGYAALNSNRDLYELNDYYLTNVGYLRVKNLTIGYTLPSKLTERAKITQLRIYFSGENILTWRFGDLTRYVDPEQAGSATNYSDPSTAADRTTVDDYPIGKTYSFGIDLQL
jgi:TonB-linked SusC/RagA family outer membrane protein